MENVELKLNENGEGIFQLMNGADLTGKMDVEIKGKNISVYHTEIAEHAEGKGFGKILLTAVVTYARAHKLKVVPLCPYVHLQFHHHAKDYEDVWQKDKS